MSLKRISTKKRGSLNLSINAIVVLILAITMLGLGLGFMKKMFGSTTGQFEEIGGTMKEQMMEDLKSANERLAMSRYDVDIKKGTKKEIFYAIKNDLSSGTCSDVQFTDIGTCQSNAGTWTANPANFGIAITCYTALEEGDEDSIKFSTVNNRAVKPDEIVVLKAIVDVPSNTKVTTYSCKIGVCEPDANQDPVMGSVPDSSGVFSCAAGGDTYSDKDFYINVVTS